MKTLTQCELKFILDLHKKWLDSDPDGVLANLIGVDLRGADLSEADLSGTDVDAAKLARLRARDTQFYYKAGGCKL